MTWLALEEGDKELAAFGRERFASRVAYLATIQKDGSPRVHPVTPIVGDGHLFVFMYATSPKGHDLRRDGRYAMHASVEDDEGGRGEFYISGYATFIEDPDMKALASQHAPYTTNDKYILFELSVENALSTVYAGDEIVRGRWRKD